MLRLPLPLLLHLLLLGSSLSRIVVSSFDGDDSVHWKSNGRENHGGGHYPRKDRFQSFNATVQQQQRRRRRRCLTEEGEALPPPNLKKQQQQHALNQNHADQLSLFSVVETIATIGPTVFPKPTQIFLASEAYKAVNHNINDDDDTVFVPHIQPIHGAHRSGHDAIFLFAVEYSVHNYMLFVTTLHDTGYRGDVVVAISSMDWSKPDVQDYLTTQHDDFPRLVVYVVPYECYNAEGEAVDSAKGGIRVCKHDGLYGRQSNNNSLIVPLPDPRHARTVQNSRYELYWIWSEQYDPYTWIMLIDARDTIFQQNPFNFVPRRQHQDRNDNTDASGVLVFFGENVEATRLGKSAHNRDWLTKAYGNKVAEELAEKPTICSGTTMGEKVAVEMYLRAMVAESDETQTVKMGADQGFHNRLYYSNKLGNTKAIKKIIVQDQGYGIVNNLGALRTKPLGSWGNGKLLNIIWAGESDTKNFDNIQNIQICNWDGTLSPVVHQFDRHKELSHWFFKRKRKDFRQRWTESKK